MSNDDKGGRSILGLSSVWNVFRRSGKDIEVGLSGHRKVRRGKFVSLMYFNPRRVTTDTCAYRSSIQRNSGSPSEGPVFSI
jgi:hypothetical protein